MPAAALKKGYILGAWKIPRPISRALPKKEDMLEVFTLLHVLISVLGICAGFGVVAAMPNGNLRHPWTGVFLGATLATSLTGFLFHFKGFTPALAFGVISTIVLASAIFALKAKRLEGSWRKTYVINALIAQYLNTFVLIAQLFQKVPELKALAPTQQEPAFGITQGLLLAVFVWLGFASVKGTKLKTA